MQKTNLNINKSFDFRNRTDNNSNKKLIDKNN